MTRLSARRLLILLGTAPAALLNQGNSSAQVGPKPQANADLLQSADRSAWKMREGQGAVEYASAILGVTELKASQIHTELAVLKDDATPYLSNKIINRPVWQVTVDGWRVSYRSMPDIKDRFVRTLDVFVDPVDAKLLKLETRWPEGEPPIAPQPSPESATEQMRRHGNEVYHGFPKDPPKFSLFDALDSVPRCGGNATEARQIIAHYVIWSRV
ncbi:MAG: hypothetical protein JSU86_05860, partial [Phycisphaerales bacterium]